MPNADLAAPGVPLTPADRERLRGLLAAYHAAADAYDEACMHGDEGAKDAAEHVAVSAHIDARVEALRALGPLLDALDAAEAREAAREIDARVEALEAAVESLLDYPVHDDRCAVFGPGPHDCSCGLDRLIDTARALLAQEAPDATPSAPGQSHRPRR